MIDSPRHANYPVIEGNSIKALTCQMVKPKEVSDDEKALDYGDSFGLNDWTGKC